MSRSISNFTWIAPLLLLGSVLGVGWWLQRTPRPTTVAEPDSTTAWVSEDFTRLKSGALPDGWLAPRGSFEMQMNRGKPMLTLLPEPMAEGRVLLQKSLRHGGGVRARMNGEKRARTYPRFGVGLQGRAIHKGSASESTFIFRASPSQRKLEIVLLIGEQESVLAAVDWEWTVNHPLWLELSAVPDDRGTSSTLEARQWREGESRPNVAAISLPSTLNPTLLRPTLNAAPFALNPIHIDGIAWKSGYSPAPSPK